MNRLREHDKVLTACSPVQLQVAGQEAFFGEFPVTLQNSFAGVLLRKAHKSNAKNIKIKRLLTILPCVRRQDVLAPVEFSAPNKLSGLG